MATPRFQVQPPNQQRRRRTTRQGGLVGALADTINNPLDFGGQAPIRDQPIVQPNPRPVDVPDPVVFSGERTTGATPERINPANPVGSPDPTRTYEGTVTPSQRFTAPTVGGVDPSRTLEGTVGPSRTFSLPTNIQAITPSQIFQMDRNIAPVAASQMQRFDPESGRYIDAPDRDFAEQGRELEEATFQRGLNRIDPYFQQERSALAQRLANQGLPIGSEAYNEALDRFDRSRSDALENLALSSIGAGRAEQGRLFRQDLDTSRFESGEAGRQFAERLAGTRFNSAEQARNFMERFQANQLAFNQDLAQNQFNAAEQARGFGERLTSAQDQFGRSLAANRFNAAEQGRGLAESLARARFDAGELGRGFGERLTADQTRFGQGLAARQFDAGEAGRGFGENLAARGFDAGESQRRFGQNLARSQFDAGRADARFGQDLAAQNQFFNQGLARDQFNAQQSRLADAFAAQQLQQQFGNRLANQNLLGQNDRFLAEQQANQFNQDLARRNQGIREQQLLRQQPFTDLAQILGLVGQVGNPQFQGTTQYGPMPVDFAGLTQNQYLGDLNAWQQQRNNLWGGLGGIASSFIPFLPFGRGGN